MNIKNVVNISNETILPTYGRNAIEFVKGKNALLWDSNGKKYIDFLSGLGVNNLGYHHPRIQKAAKKAIGRPWHVTNLFQIKEQAQLAKELLPQGFTGKTFFANSGTEANEAAYKFAIKYGKTIEKDKIKVLSALNSFHGRSFASLNLTGQKKIKDSFSPLLPNVKHFTFNNPKSFLAKIDDKVAAVILECVQGEGGIYIANKSFMKEVESKCREHRVLLFIDEVQSGNFRTGKQYSFEHYDVVVDGFTTAKALASGLPIGAFTVRRDLAEIFAPGDHGSTFGGNPLVTSVGLATLKELKTIAHEGDLKKKINLFSEFISVIKKDKTKFSQVKEVRQLGMMIAIELTASNITAKILVKKCLDRGLIIGSCKDNIIRLLPPLVIKNDHIKRGIKILQKVMSCNTEKQ